MNKIDLHVHTIASGHAFNTLYELAAAAEKMDMEAIAITDHGPEARNAADLSYFYVLCNRIPANIGNIRIFKGIEANILDMNGNTDIPEDPDIRSGFDLILAFMHPITSYKDQGKMKNTKAVLKAMAANPCIDILAHPVTTWYDIDEIEVAKAAAAGGVAIELNELTLQSRGIDIKKMELLIENTLLYKGKFAVSSDAHIASELGLNKKAQEMVNRFGIGKERIINSSLEQITAFINLRKINKKI